MEPVAAARVRAALGDAWQVLSASRAELPGVRLAATGLPHPQWNTGDVDDPALVDLAAVRRWYDALGVPWGLRLPRAAPWPHGRRVLSQRLMERTYAPSTAPAAPVGAAAGLTVRPALPADEDAVAAVDAAAFGAGGDQQRRWLALLLAHPAVDVVLAEADGAAVGTGYVVHSAGRAGPAAYLAGIGVVPAARRRGVGTAVSADLVVRGAARGASFAHLHPDDDRAARLYARLGFVEVDGLDIYVDH